MNEIDLRRADLNLLVVFQTLLTERHVGRAARRLALTQSAASHALGRLRTMFGDPLFVRHPKGIEPTPRALALATEIADILDRTRSVLASPGFDASMRRSFTVATVDPYVPIILVPLMERLRAFAPAIDLRILSIPRHDIIRAFDRQDIDLAILNFSEPPSRIASRPLLQDRFVGIGRRGHPGLEITPLTREAFAKLPHLLVSLTGDLTGLCDAPLPEIDDLGRRIVLTVPYVLAVPGIVATTDLVALVYERVARRFADAFDLAVFEVPISIPDFTVHLLMSATRARDPALVWLQEQISHACCDDAPCVALPEAPRSATSPAHLLS
jgi:DNA-binding transcriptional LysR family regulator